jgi:hypothetical protein
MAEESTNPFAPKPEAENETPPRPLTIWDNTPEEEEREIEAFMEWAWAELESSLPPYAWGGKQP